MGVVDKGQLEGNFLDGQAGATEQSLGFREQAVIDQVVHALARQFQGQFVEFPVGHAQPGAVKRRGPFGDIMLVDQTFEPPNLFRLYGMGDKGMQRAEQLVGMVEQDRQVIGDDRLQRVARCRRLQQGQHLCKDHFGLLVQVGERLPVQVVEQTMLLMGRVTLFKLPEQGRLEQDHPAFFWLPDNPVYLSFAYKQDASPNQFAFPEVDLMHAGAFSDPEQHEKVMPVRPQRRGVLRFPQVKYL